MVIYISWNPFGQYTSPYHCKKWVGSHGCYVSGAEWETWLSSVKAGIAQLPDRLPCFDFVLRILSGYTARSDALRIQVPTKTNHIRSGTKIRCRKPKAVHVYHTRCLALQSLEKWQADTFMSTITRWSWHQWHVLCRSSDPQLLSLPSPSFMSLDQNLFTLQFVPHKQYNNVIDLVDSSGNLHYRKQRITSSEYKIEVYGNSHYSS